jgi:glycerol-3-phosphate O-acyltransferase / dihydroxyacetone phosphate acyltransferase
MDYRNIRKSKGWIYNILLPAIHLEYRMLFRKIYLYNRKGVPSNKPVLIASNHPTAFIDPIFFCIFFDPPVYNMTRGDIFRKPFFRKLLEHCNMFPVYRQRDGYDKRDRNDEVFEYCQKKMLEGVAVNIFVEGEHHLDKRVLPIQKGIARIAFGTYANHPMDELQIVPVGCNYVAGDCLRDEAKIIVGQPMFIKDYWERYQENPNAAINTLCADIKKALLSICYHIEDRADDALAEQLLTIWRNDHPGNIIPVVEISADRFFAEKKLLDQLNTMSGDQKRELSAQASTYFEGLKAAGLDDETLVQPKHGDWSWLAFLIIGFLPFTLGSIISWPIRSLSQFVTKKVVKKREFRTSILLGVGTLGSIFYYFIFFLLGLIQGWPTLLSLVILLPVLTWFSIFWNERLMYWLAARRAVHHPDRARLLKLRSAISNDYSSEV